MKTVCLNMIVKDESHIIGRTLINIIKYVKIDYWVICDTGSSDNTIEIIQDFFKCLNIPGEIHRHKWTDFSHNRNLSLEAAFGKTDYLFIFDADDEIHGSFKLPNDLTKDSYMVLFGGGYSYKRTSIINNRKKWKYFGVLHEVIIGEDEMTESQLISGDYHFVSGRTGRRSMNPNKYHDDAVILEEAFHNTHEVWLKNRYAFYCAQSYKDAKNPKKAIEWYKKTLSLDCWQQEKFYATYMVGVLEQQSNNICTAMSYYLLTLTYDPKRWEGLYFAIQHLLTSKQDNLANILISGIDITNTINPREGKTLFINDSIHDYKMYITIIIVAHKYGNYEKGRQAQLNLYDNFEYLPESIAKNTIHNSKFFIPDDITVQNYLDKTFDFVQKYVYKYMRNISSSTDKLDRNILDTYIKKYNNIFHFNGDFKPSICSATINIVLTMTSCMRPELLRRTIKSMTRNWTDFGMVDKIICVDDGTEKKELDSLTNEYPWIEFIVKGEYEKGHRSSMNLIHNYVITSGARYWIHIEDDWEFIKPANYISRGIDCLNKYSDQGVKQVLFNKGYAEIISDITWICGTRLEDGLLLHKHDASDSPCGYWPHYSFRPGITSVDVLETLGDFNTPNSFFELDYANKFADAGYKTAYFDEITCIHIGKLAGKRGCLIDKNSYELNGVDQGLNYSPPTLPIKVLNLLRRSDRRENMKREMKDARFDFKDAVDGRLLRSDDPRLLSFVGNDFNSNPGAIGCAISHIELWKELMADTTTEYYIIMEDDIKLKDSWFTDLLKISRQLEVTDTVMLGYSMFSDVRKGAESLYRNDETPNIYELNVDRYIGGFFCYSINKNAAQKILRSLSVTGIKHGIDYLVMKTIPELTKKEIRPQIAFTDWNEGGKPIDTDIQNSTESIVIDIPSHVMPPNVRVKIVANYCSSSQARDEFGVMGKTPCQWNNIVLVANEPYDYLVIINKPRIDDPLFYNHDKKRTIIFQMEPWCAGKNWGVNTWGNWSAPNPDEYLAVIGRGTQTYNNVFWQLEKTYAELQDTPIKTGIISSICSSKYFDPGHIKRIDFLKYLESKSNPVFDVDIFNVDNEHNFRNYKGGVTPFINKSNGMLQYKYYFMCENNFEPGFITEKLWEPILCESLVFYCGAPDVSRYVDPLSYVAIDLDDFDKAYEIISNAITSDLYSQRLPNIKKMKRKLLDEMQFFPRIDRIIRSSL
jgi:GR25 family glycosyltransferase involved in LPS biosynthesis/tetratricopeptide (TPR) repeat protein